MIDKSPLLDAFFESDDPDESSQIKDLIDAVEERTPWPKEFYESGDAKQFLGDHALQALATIVQHIKDEEEMERLDAERNMLHPVPLAIEYPRTKGEGEGKKKSPGSKKGKQTFIPTKKYNLMSSTQIVDRIKAPESPTAAEGKEKQPNKKKRSVRPCDTRSVTPDLR